MHTTYRIKLSLLIRYIVLLCAFVMMGYLRLLPFEAGGDIKIHLTIVASGVLMIFIIAVYKGTFWKKLQSRIFNWYIFGYIAILFFSSFYTVVNYNYTFREIIIAMDPFLYIIFALPLAYEFYYEKGFQTLFRGIIILEIMMLLIKSVTWFAYNFKGIDIFNQILFQYGIWLRDGFQRIDTGLFFGVTTVLAVRKFFEGEILWRWLYFSLLVFFFMYLLFVTRARYQTIVFIVTVAVEVYVYLKPKNKVIYWMLVIALLAIVIARGHIFNLLLSFSANNVNYGKSTMSRLLTVEHYWKYICEKKAVFGLGLLNSNNSQAYSLMERTDGVAEFYHLTDIGVLGGFVRFGLLAIWIYGLFYFYLIKTYRKYSVRKHKDAPILAGLAVWIVLWGAGNNFLDSSRAFEFPFYLAIISYYYKNMKELEKDEKI